MNDYFEAAGLQEQKDVDIIMENTENDERKLLLDEMKKNSIKSLVKDLKIWKFCILSYLKQFGSKKITLLDDEVNFTEELSRIISPSFDHAWKLFLKSNSIAITPEIFNLDLSQPPSLPYLPEKTIRKLINSDDECHAIYKKN